MVITPTDYHKNVDPAPRDRRPRVRCHGKDCWEYCDANFGCRKCHRPLCVACHEGYVGLCRFCFERNTGGDA